jgi:1-acyl-sn-glycerol-3-phosphate acyltransferase
VVVAVAKEERRYKEMTIQEKIKDYEQKGWFDKDILDDPPIVPLDPNKLDLTRKKILSKIKTEFAYMLAIRHLKNSIKTKQLIITDTLGLENIKGFNGGAIVTCNHFHPNDSLAVACCLKDSFKDLKKYRMYRVVREGNYSQKGFLGHIMRNCDTLPVNEESSNNLRVTAKTMGVVREVLAQGKKVLVYPEQAMWPNYPKPRPLKSGAFMMAAKNNAPIIPCFITFKDAAAGGVDAFGMPVQEYVFHVLSMIYPNASLSMKQNAEAMRSQNAKLWQDKYAEAYDKGNKQN